MSQSNTESDNSGAVKDDKTAKSLKWTSAEDADDDLEHPPTKQRLDSIYSIFFFQH